MCDSTEQPRILITGSRGFIGGHLCEALRFAGLPFDALVREGAGVGSRSLGQLPVKWPEGLAEVDFKPFAAVVHLAHAPVSQHMDDEVIHSQNVRPVEIMIRRLRETNPNCLFILLSSQSALPDTDSKYGRLKFHLEQLLRESEIKWTIVRPGLVFGKGARGLFSSMSSLIRFCPVIPLIGSGSGLIQPVYVKDVVQALVHILREPIEHHGSLYQLASKPISFKKFMQQLILSLGRPRLLVPIPVLLLSTALGLLERVHPNPPFSASNLLGFLHLKLLDGEASWKRLKLEPTPLEIAIAEAMGSET